MDLIIRNDEKGRYQIQNFTIEFPTVKLSLIQPKKSIYETIASFAGASTNKKSLTNQEIEKIAISCIKSQHFTAIEPLNFYIEIENMSRVCSHQFVRSRLMSIIQQSQRYNKIESPYKISYFAVEDTPLEAHDYIINSILESCLVYEKLIINKVSKEQARYVLSPSICTNINCSVNARELAHILNLRLCRRTQSEYRFIADLIYKEITNICLNEPYDMEPFLDIFRPNCVSDCAGRKCHESNSCKKPRIELEGVLTKK